MKIKLDTTTKPNPIVNNMIAVRVVDSWLPRYKMLHSVKFPYPHFSDESCEEVPIGAIEAWVEVE